MHRFRITVESLNPATENAGTEGDALQFDVVNHDDMVAIARRMVGRFDLDEASSYAFAIGLKLFGEIVLKNRDRVPFSVIRPAFGEFMKLVKQRPPEEQAK
jgi:hypothetical protein